MWRTKFQALVSTCLAALLASCVVTPPPDQPAQPASPDQSASAVAQSGYASEPEPAYPPEQPETAQPDYPSEPPPVRVERPAPPPPREPAVDAPAYPPDSPPPPRQAAPPRQPGQQRPHQPAERPNTVVPSRRARLGPIAEFSIEPTAGPVGTTITIYGDFTGVRNPNQIGVSFAGTRRVVKPVYVASDRVAVIVPKGARTGEVVVNLRNRSAWRGRFAVTARDNDLFQPTPVDSGLVGAVYRLAPNTERLPSFSTMGKPYATIVVPSLRVSPRRFDSGFPGLEDTGESLLEWFAIRFIGRLSVPASGNYQFRVHSDDGARLYIDERLVIDNDGVHAPRSNDGSIDLAAGSHDVVVEYFQGPRYEIALELSWKHSGRGWELVPPEAFSRYTGGNECSSGEPQMFCCAGTSPECRACRDNARRASDDWKARCAGVVPPGPGPGPGPGPAPVDCSNEPQRFCCQAQSAQCNQCRKEAAAERTQWLQACGKPGAGGPATPAPVDCSNEPQRFCCQAQTAQCNQCRQLATSERAQWLQQCGTPGNPATPVPAPPSPIDCRQQPERMCCAAATAECRQCRREAAAERQQWTQKCGGPAPGGPAQPAPVDCRQQPERMCCAAATAECQQCRKDAASERAQWMQQCGGQAPGNPGKPVLDCSKEPEPMCCSAATAQCQQCQRDAEDQRREWRRLCRPANNPDVDCSNRPSRGCCKALTAECRSCQDQAKAELDRWQAACN